MINRAMGFLTMAFCILKEKKMARLESNKKMGYYPTPEKTLYHIRQWIDGGSKTGHYLDPCCGEGRALDYISTFLVKTWGVELDIERAYKSSECLQKVIQCSIFDAHISSKSMGLLWLNPPYDNHLDGERVEMKFLKHSIKWLCDDGILVFIVPEHVLEKSAYRQWIGEHFYDVEVMRIHREDYPRFKQAVLLGRKRIKREEGKVLQKPTYRHIEEVEIVRTYTVPDTVEPEVFRSSEAVTDEEIGGNRSNVISIIKDLAGHEDKGEIRPLFPLKKGHLVSLITAGYLDGKVYNPDGSFIVVKGYSDRIRKTQEEDDKHITTHTYSTGIRVIDPNQGGWYDIR